MAVLSSFNNFLLQNIFLKLTNLKVMYMYGYFLSLMLNYQCQKENSLKNDTESWISTFPPDPHLL